MNVRISEDFRIAFKRLKKRYRSLETDFERLLASLLANPFQGVELEDGVRKVRLASYGDYRIRSYSPVKANDLLRRL